LATWIGAKSGASSITTRPPSFSSTTSRLSGSIGRHASAGAAAITFEGSSAPITGAGRQKA
jgi:hypothetical protein